MVRPIPITPPVRARAALRSPARGDRPALDVIKRRAAVWGRRPIDRINRATIPLQLLVSGIIGRDHARGGSWSARKQARAVIGDWKYV